MKHVRAVYRQRIYYYLVKFSGMLHCWLQRYHTRIRTLRSSLVYCFMGEKGLFEDGLSVIKSETVKSGWFIIFIERFRSRCGVVDKPLAL